MAEAGAPECTAPTEAVAYSAAARAVARRAAVVEVAVARAEAVWVAVARAEAVWVAVARAEATRVVTVMVRVNGGKVVVAFAAFGIQRSPSR